MGRKAVDSKPIFIDGLYIPVADRIGEEGKGFRYILHSLNPERILNAAEAIGIGRMRCGAPRNTPTSAWCSAGRSAEPGHPASAGRELDVRSRRPGRWRCSAAGSTIRPALRRRGQRCQVPRRAARPRGGLRRCGPMAASATRRNTTSSAVPRSARHAHRADDRADDPQLHRREGAGFPEKLLRNLHERWPDGSRGAVGRASRREVLRPPQLSDLILRSREAASRRMRPDMAQRFREISSRMIPRCRRRSSDARISIEAAIAYARMKGS